MKRLVIFRGPSGSGKSTAATKFLLEDPHSREESCQRRFEADQFFMDKGKYNFDASQLGQAHNWCQCLVHDAMSTGVTPIVVSNTSMTKREVRPYLDLAEQHGYEVTIYKIKGPWDAKKFSERNVHNVPLYVVERQISKYQPIEGEIEYE